MYNNNLIYQKDNEFWFNQINNDNYDVEDNNYHNHHDPEIVTNSIYINNDQKFNS